MANFRGQKKFLSNNTVGDGYDVWNNRTNGSDFLVADDVNNLADSVRELQRSLLDGYASTNLLARSSTYGGPSFEDGQTLVYSSTQNKLIPGASGDASFKIQSISATGTIVLKGGSLILDDGRELATYDGSGTTTSDYFVDISFDLDSLTLIEGGSTTTGTYYLYIDLATLAGSATTITSGASQGRKVFSVTSLNLAISSSSADQVTQTRYLPIGYIRNTGGANLWSSSIFGSLAFRRHGRPVVNISPIVFVQSGITSSTTTITHNQNLIPNNQRWLAIVTTSIDGFQYQLSDSWIVNLTNNSATVDFSFLDSGDTVVVKLENTVISANVVPTKTYDSGVVAANTVSLPISHNLGMIPTSLVLLRETTSGRFESLTAGDYLDVSSSTIDGSLSILGTDNIRIVASAAPDAIAAGEASVAPLTLTSGANLTTPAAGVIEYDGTTFYATPNTSYKRATIPTIVYTSGAGTTGITLTTNYAIFPAANDTITLPIGTYRVKLRLRVAVSGSTVSSALNLNLRGAGNAAGTVSWDGTGAILDSGASSSFIAAATDITTNIAITAASAANPRQYIAIGEGILKITTAGTIIPSYRWTATLTSGTTTLPAENYMTIESLDTQSAAAFGPAGSGWG